ncbi:carbohydrate kinase family protein [Halobiforma nitratireducens]|uniref:PfkB domain-containing protein n=1 Tax=Halobiforma nitratireducens JCM 10879 TaxID=1227454 RepID=M0LF11_9EURY|nr:PfkB family carbohydrate kinase [Halobiforma nitratireducens]EMA30560.1 PfkB domain-containing protein [Halobiforma nitratireducens JCM 10879]
MVRVLTAGHVNWDVTLRIDDFPEPDGEAAIRSQRQSGGGSAANVAAALAGLEIEAGLIGSVGDDENGVLARRNLEDVGVSLEGVRVVENAETAVKYLLVDDGGEVAILGNDGVNEAVTPADLDRERVRAAEHVHLTSQRADTAAAIANEAREGGATVSFDPGRRLAERRREYGDALAAADVVFANDREVAALLEDEYEYVGSGFDDRIIVVKHGGDGAKVHTPEATYEHPGFDVEPVDTAGAGDAFAAGFLAVVLEDGDVERALEHANACGAITASREGARSAPTAKRVAEFLEERY